MVLIISSRKDPKGRRAPTGSLQNKILLSSHGGVVLNDTLIGLLDIREASTQLEGGIVYLVWPQGELGTESEEGGPLYSHLLHTHVCDG